MNDSIAGRRLALTACAVLVAFAIAAPAASARDTTPPTTPTGVRVASVTEDSISLAWNRSTDDSGRIHTYLVCYSGFCLYEGTSGSATITGLVPGTAFTFQVKAMDPSGNESALSSPVTGTTASDLTAPTTPGGLRVTATSPSSVSLAWERSTDRWGLGYQVFMDGQLIGGSAGETLTQRDLAPGSTHTFAVRARDSAGNLSGFSNSVTVTLQASGDTVAPTAPRNLSGAPVPELGGADCGIAQLTWDASTDNADPQSAIEYRVLRNGAFFDVSSRGTPSYFIYGFPGTATWTVLAVDQAGNISAPSNPVTLTLGFDETRC
jgi:chitodextrinase